MIRLAESGPVSDHQGRGRDLTRYQRTSGAGWEDAGWGLSWMFPGINIRLDDVILSQLTRIRQ